MGAVFSIRRDKDGGVHHDKPLPEVLTVPMGWFESGGIEGTLVEVNEIKKCLASGDFSTFKPAGSLSQVLIDGVLAGNSVSYVLEHYVSTRNLNPLFERDGMDMIFTFPEGQVRYRFIGFQSFEGGKLNSDAPMFELAEV